MLVKDCKLLKICATRIQSTITKAFFLNAHYHIHSHNHTSVTKENRQTNINRDEIIDSTTYSYLPATHMQPYIHEERKNKRTKDKYQFRKYLLRIPILTMKCNTYSYTSMKQRKKHTYRYNSSKISTP